MLYLLLQIPTYITLYVKYKKEVAGIRTRDSRLSDNESILNRHKPLATHYSNLIQIYSNL